jgi:hypothetical protein
MSLIPPRPPQERGIILVVNAVRQFKEALTEEERQDFEKLSTEDAETALEFLSRLSEASCRRKGRQVGFRVNRILQFVRSFVLVVDTFVSADPTVAALVWGSVEVTMLVCVAPQ